MTNPNLEKDPGPARQPGQSGEPVLEARGMIKLFGKVVGLVRRRPQAVPRRGARGHRRQRRRQVDADQVPVRRNGPGRRRDLRRRSAGLVQVHEGCPRGRHRDRLPDPRGRARAGHLASNLFLARESAAQARLGSVLRMLDTGVHEGRLTRSDQEARHQHAAEHQPGSRDAVRWPAPGGRRRPGRAFGGKVVILDEPTAALGVRETGQVLGLVKDLRERGLGIILISHNMPNVFEVADRIHIQRLGGAVGVITPKSHTPAEAVAIMTGAAKLELKPGGEVPAAAPS